MVHQCGLQLIPTLIASGLMNIISGVLFRIPMPVQPMKAIAAVAITEGLNEAQILTAGLGTAVVILLFGITGFIDVLNRAIPKSVVRGLQLALGLKLLACGFVWIAGTGRWNGLGQRGGSGQPGQEGHSGAGGDCVHAQGAPPPRWHLYSL